MRAQRIPSEEQRRLVMECRSSGLTDYQWCLQHDIKPGTFYNWVRRLKEKGVNDIPSVSGKQEKAVPQEIVKIELTPPITKSQDERIGLPPEIPASFLEVNISGVSVKIPNGTDPKLLLYTLRLVKELSC